MRLEWRSWGAERKRPTFRRAKPQDNLTSFSLLRCIIFSSSYSGHILFIDRSTRRHASDNWYRGLGIDPSAVLFLLRTAYVVVVMIDTHRHTCPLRELLEPLQARLS